MIIRGRCFYLATLGGFGKLRIGGFLASLGALPALFIFKALSFLHPNFFLLASIIFIAALIFVLQGALYFHSEQQTSIIVLDKTLGTFLIFLGTPLTLKFILVGLLLFHGCIFFRPIFINRVGAIDFRYLPGVFSIIAGDVIYGILINGFFKMVVWLAS